MSFFVFSGAARLRRDCNFMIYKATLGKKVRANGGCLGYPEAKKDVVSCEKSRGSANRN